MSRILMSVGFAAASALAMLGGNAGTAEAGGKHHHHGHHHHGHHHGHHHHFHGHGHGLIIGGGGHGCGYAYDRWQYTGSRYWKHRYYECKGWY